MDFEEFETVFKQVKAEKPLWLEGEMEPLATEEQISKVELRLGFKLPGQYREFLKTIGSGYFGFTNIFSVNPFGDWFLPEKITQFDLSDGFLPITDDETGGYYGFKVDGNVCSEAVYYFHPDDFREPIKKYSTFLDYVAEVGLKK